MATHTEQPDIFEKLKNFKVALLSSSVPTNQVIAVIKLVDNITSHLVEEFKAKDVKITELQKENERLSVEILKLGKHFDEIVLSKDDELAELREALKEANENMGFHGYDFAPLKKKIESLLKQENPK